VSLKLANDSVASGGNIIQSTNPIFYINPIANVGISTSTPQSKLHIIGGVKMSNLDGSYRVPVADTELVPKYYVDENFTPITGGSGTAFLQGGNSFGTTATLGTKDAYSLDFITSSTTRMTIDSSGNVGIGTTSPGADLHINETLKLGDTFGANNTHNVQIDGSILIGNTFDYDSNYPTRTDFVIGNMSGNSRFLFGQSNGAYGGLEWYNNATASNALLSFYTNGQDMVFKPSNTEIMRMTTGGNVGIATTTPQAKLHVIGAAKMSNLDGSYRVPVDDTELVPRKYVDDNFAPITGGSGSAFLQGGNSFGTTAVLGTNDAYNLDLITSSTTRMTIDSSGNVGVGTNSPGYKLDVYGTSATDAIRTYSGLDIKRVDTPASVAGTPQSGTELGIGDYYYRVSYITDLGESSPKLSGIITTTSGNQQILLSLPVSDDPRVTGRKIYRTEVNGPSYSMGTVTTVTNNTDTTYLDSTPDVNLTNVSSESYFKVNSTTNYITVDGTPAMMLDTQRTSFGFGAGANNDGGENTYVGFNSGGNSSGSRQAFFGRYAGASAVGSNLTIIGPNAGGSAETSRSVLLGGHAGYFVKGNYSTFVGQYAGYTSGAQITGSGNTVLGYFALGNYNVDFTGGYNVFLGYMSGRQTGQLMSASNSIAIGKDTYTTKSNQIVLGNVNIVETLLRGNVGIATTTPQAKLHVIGGAKMSNLDGSYRVPVADTELVPKKYVDDNFASIIGGASAVFVGLTTNSYNGNQSGYTTANSICAGEYTDSHICTTQEVLYTINSGNSSSVPVTTAWMSGGAPGYTANANDCQGWKSSSHGDYGKVWIKLAVGDDGFGALSWCDETAPFMCCK
jgi:hypothetical protein